MRVVTHIPIKVFRRPKHANSPKYSVRTMSDERFPGLKNAAQRVPCANLDQNMHVVWHHTPTYQGVALTIESEECPLYEFGNLRNCEVAAAMSLVQRNIGRLDAMIPRSAGKFLANRNWEAVGQPEHDVLNHIGRVEVRQVTARAPSSWPSPGIDVAAGGTPAVRSSIDIIGFDECAGREGPRANVA